MTTDENWKACVVAQTVTLVHKLLSLDSLAFYWNCHSKQFSTLDKKSLEKKFQDSIASNSASGTFIPKDLKYVLAPIVSKVKIVMNLHPEPEFTIPKISIDGTMEEIQLCLSKYQFQDIMDLLESFEWMDRASKFQKYRPPKSIQVKGNAKLWWKFAYQSVLNELVRRRRRNWSWNHMKAHRVLCKNYQNVYYTKLIKSISADAEKSIKEYENILDVNNILMIRKRVDTMVEQKGLKKKVDPKPSGWFGGWWKSSDKPDSSIQDSKLGKKFDELMSPEEWSKLYKAIDYDQNAVQPMYPLHFVENKFTFLLSTLKFCVSEVESTGKIMDIEFKKAACCLEQRPSADAMKVQASVDNFRITGFHKERKQLCLVKPIVTNQDEPLINVCFQTNPLNVKCDQQIIVMVFPICMTYNAAVINKLAEAFQPRQNVTISNKMKAVAYSTMEDLREKSSLGIEYAIQTHKILDLKVDIMPSHLIVPYKGDIESNESLAIVNLGHLQIQSVRSKESNKSIKEMLGRGNTTDEIMVQLLDYSYETLLIELSEVQCLLALTGEDWKEAMKEKHTPLHLIKPIDLKIDFKKSLLATDPRFPHVKVKGEIDYFGFHISDVRLLELAKLAASIPLPASSGEQGNASSVDPDTVSQSNYITDSNRASVRHSEIVGKGKETDLQADEALQMTDLLIDFQIKVMELIINEEKGTRMRPIFSFSATALETEMSKRTYDFCLDLKLGNISLRHNERIHMIQSSATEEMGNYLCKLRFSMVDENSPELKTKYNYALQTIDIKLSEISINLYEESLLQLLKFNQELSEKLNQYQKPTTEPVQRIKHTDSTLQVAKASTAQMARKKKSSNLIDLIIKAHLETLNLTVSKPKEPILEVHIVRMQSIIEMKKTELCVVLKLKDLQVIDPYPKTLCHNILTTVDANALDFVVQIYHESDIKNVDCRIRFTLGGSKIIFVNKFVTEILNFVNKFDVAKRALLQASAVAAETARQNVELAYSKAYKVALEIHVQAPIIIMPESTQSKAALLLNLGDISVKNNFRNNVTINELGAPACIEYLDITLVNLQCSRVVYNYKNMIPSTQLVLIKPITMKISIIRNLSVSWFKNMPEFQITGQLEAVQIAMGLNDYLETLAILQTNLSEGQTTSAPETEIIATDQEVGSNKPLTDDVNYKSEVDVQLSHLGIFYEKVSFRISFHEIELTLYHTRNDLELCQGNVEHTGENKFCCFILSRINATGKLLSDGSMWSQVVLVDCELNTYKKKVAISRFICKGRTNETAPMIDITFRMEKDLRKFAEVRVCAINVILYMPILMEISNFLSSPTYSSTSGKKTLYSRSLKNVSTIKAKQSTVSTVNARPSTATTQKQTPSAGPLMTLNVIVIDPNFFVVENINDINTRAIALGSGISLKLRMSAYETSLQLWFTDLNVFSCCFNPALRDETFNPIISPCSIAAIGNSPIDEGMHIDVTISDIVVQLTPGTLVFLSNLNTSLNTDEDDLKKEKVTVVDYSNVWMDERIYDNQFWYLESTEIFKDVEVDPGIVVDSTDDVKRKEQLILNSTSVSCFMEMGRGRISEPVIHFQSHLSAEVTNWSTQVQVTGYCSAEIAYFNHKLSIWEPVLEPVEDKGDSVIYHRPWEITLQIEKKEIKLEDIEINLDTELDALLVQSNSTYATAIKVESQDDIAITISKTFLDLVNILNKTFTITKEGGPPMSKLLLAPYVIQNDLGLNITLILRNSPFQMPCAGEVHEIELESGTNVYLINTDDANKTAPVSGKSLLLQKKRADTTFLHMKILNQSEEHNISVNSIDVRIFPVHFDSVNIKDANMVVDISMPMGCKVVQIRSNVQIQNHFTISLLVYYLHKETNEFVRAGRIYPGKKVALPIPVVCLCDGEICVSTPNYGRSKPFSWKMLLRDIHYRTTVSCAPDNPAAEPFHILVHGDMELAYFGNTFRRTSDSAAFLIHLEPPVVVMNFVPFKIDIYVKNVETVRIDEGKTEFLSCVKLDTIPVTFKILNYQGRDWECHKTCLTYNDDQLQEWQFDSCDVSRCDTMHLGVHASSSKGSNTFALFAPFWMINKTGLTLAYKALEAGLPLEHPPDLEGPVMFCYRGKAFGGKKKASVSVENSNWSEKMSLDTVGDTGILVCKAEGMAYKIGVNIQLSKVSLTKLITFTPYFMLQNKSNVNIHCHENCSDPCDWVTVPANGCVAFWPIISEAAYITLVAKVEGEKANTAPFTINTVHNTTLKLRNKYGAINVDIHITDNLILIALDLYRPGLAPLRLVNDSSFTIQYQEENVGVKRTLTPEHMVMFSWEKPMIGRRFIWFCNGVGCINLLTENQVGQVTVNEKQLYWVSFLDGLQRTILVTDDFTKTLRAETNLALEQFNSKISILLHSAVISLVNNELGAEITCISIQSTSMMWQTFKLKGNPVYKTLPVAESVALEAAYQRYLIELQVKSDSEQLVNVGRNQINFTTMTMHQPKTRNLRRFYKPGISLEYISSSHCTHIYATIQQFQVDNQLLDCVFPVIFARVPPPKSVVREAGLKPLVELSILQRRNEHNPIKQYQYFRILIQECHLKIDHVFLSSTMDLFSSGVIDADKFYLEYVADMEQLSRSIVDIVASRSNRGQVNFYELLHFSPLKIHLSFTLDAGSAAKTTDRSRATFFQLLFKSFGVTVTEMHDVVFRLGFFERRHKFLSTDQLTDEAASHYTSQGLRQLYVLVLGLDVFGNPMNLLMGVTQGLEDFFYEPFQGAVQGPSEFAEGIVIGVQSLVGHTVGGAAGAVSRITGTLGKTMAVLSMDEKHQQNRRSAKHHQQAQGIGSGLAHTGKDLVMGVVDGITGVVTKPIAGARSEGVGGFFKGFGKGILGLVTRPTGGVVDFASGSFDAVKRIADHSLETVRVRPRRFISQNKVIQPYVRHEAEGAKMLRELRKGRYAKTDDYIAHLMMPPNISVFMVTTKRLIYMERGILLGFWEVQWEETWKDMDEEAVDFRDGNIIVPSKQVKGRVIAIENLTLSEWLFQKVSDTQKRATH